MVLAHAGPPACLWLTACRPPPSWQLLLEPPVHITAGSTRGFAIYTNSLCGVALRFPSTRARAGADSLEDKDTMGVKIGNTSVPIVACLQPRPPPPLPATTVPNVLGMQRAACERRTDGARNS